MVRSYPKPITIRTNVENAACRRVVERCGGVLDGYEPTQPAKLVAALIEIIEEKGIEGAEIWNKRELDFIENNKNGVCIYHIHEHP